MDSALATETFSEGRVVVWTDGACTDNQHAALRRAGVGAFWAQRHFRNVSVPLQGDTQTNQRAELTAVILVLKSEPRPLEVRSDSQYCVRGFESLMDAEARGWRTASGKELANVDLWQEAHRLLAVREPNSFRIRKVKGHSSFLDVQHGRTTELDKTGNDAADGLAVAGAALHAVGPPRRSKLAIHLTRVQAVQRLMLEICLERGRGGSSNSGGKRQAARLDRYSGRSSSSSSSSNGSNSSSRSSSSSSSSDDDSNSSNDERSNSRACGSDDGGSDMDEKSFVANDAFDDDGDNNDDGDDDDVDDDDDEDEGDDTEDGDGHRENDEDDLPNNTPLHYHNSRTEAACFTTFPTLHQRFVKGRISPAPD